MCEDRTTKRVKNLVFVGSEGWYSLVKGRADGEVTSAVIVVDVSLLAGSLGTVRLHIYL
jgi:hypothetical protein